MVTKANRKELRFEELGSSENFAEYIFAVQKAGVVDYIPMMKIIRSIF